MYLEKQPAAIGGARGVMLERKEFLSATIGEVTASTEPLGTLQETLDRAASL